MSLLLLFNHRRKLVGGGIPYDLDYYNSLRIKTKERIEEERIALGILPPKVAKIVEGVASEVVLDDYREDRTQIAVDLLKIRLYEQELVYDSAYLEALKNAISFYVTSEIQSLFAIKQEEDFLIEIILLVDQIH